jgi:tRNA threonylcarbamoyladenosine biosynthesis protein TsaB
MKLLAIDTATDACSAALYIEGETLSHFELAPRRHAELILSMMDRLLVEAGLQLSELDALAFGRGPGAFTGVRIATGVVQGAAFGACLAVVPISNLAALAQRAVRELRARRVLSALDARMGEVYWGGYVLDSEGLVSPIFAEAVVSPQSVVLPEGSEWWGVGSGWDTYADQLRRHLGDRLEGVHPSLNCHALDIALLAARDLARGQAVSPEQALPIYLRDQVVQKAG